MHNKEYKGSSEILQEPTKTDGKKTAGKGKQPTTNRTQSPIVKQRKQRTRSKQVRYNFSEDEEGLHDADDETQGYVCISADPRKSGSAEGGENFIITSKELRLSLQAQCKTEDQSDQMSSPDDISLHLQRQQELSTQDRAPSVADTRALELESEWGTQETCWRTRTGVQTLTKIPPGSLILSP
jgi:hypothetical protein